MDRYEEMVTFVRVVESRSFIAAAEALGMSQSGVSKAVSRLEESPSPDAGHRQAMPGLSL